MSGVKCIFAPAEWKDISSIPESGMFIGWHPDHGPVIFYVSDHSGEKRLYDSEALDHGNYFRVNGLTLWTPLPSPPSFDGAKLADEIPAREGN